MYSDLLPRGSFRARSRRLISNADDTVTSSSVSLKVEECNQNISEELLTKQKAIKTEAGDKYCSKRVTPSGVCKGGLTNPVNKRNATYLTQEEYDEDLAQLDILLHYVNNLSASLEFLQWEKKRISTDLVPTLLNMYDALYAKFTESSQLSSQDCLADSVSEEEKNRVKEEREEADKKLGKLQEKELFVSEGCEKKEKLSHTSPNSNHISPDVLCENCNNFKSSSVEVCNRCHTVPRLEIIENDYDIPESVERDTDSLQSCSPKLSLSHVPFLKTSSPATSFRSSKDRPRFRSLIEDTNNGAPKTTLARSLSNRPVSVISSSSSSSSSSNSLPRGPPGGGLASYMASAESLNDNDTSLHSETDPASRRRDRGLKARREKALRAGSDDSGVQCHIISLPVPPTVKPRYCDPNLHYMDRVVLEIVETEELYVRDLNDVIEGYLEYWRKYPVEGLPPSTVEFLFSNIEQIYHFNRSFLGELDKCGTDPVAVAKCFVRNNAGFAIYTEYCTNYPRTVSLLTDLMREEKSVRACRERQLALCHTLPLGSYLLKPVQRVLKYHLLLGNIVKNFGNDRPGHSHIWNALSAMTGIAHHINDMKRRHEHAVRVQEIQSLLYGWQGEDLTTYGELAAEGNFKMFGFKGLRHVFLFDKMLLITKRKDENFLVYKAHIMCSDLMLIESIPGEPLSFHVIPFDNPKCQYTLECRNLDQKREWTLQLKRVILENYSATIPAHARQLVMELGQVKNNELSGNEWKTGGRKSHHAPEYLERRKDKRRTSEGGFNSRLRIRRSSRTRKTKEDKENRSRSVSRTRETDDEESRKHSTNSAPSPGEKSRLRLPLWRRRSEPGISGGLQISSPQNTPKTPPPEVKKIEKEDSIQLDEKTDVDSRDGISPSEGECDQIFNQYDCDETESTMGENLEHIVSQLLQHQLQVQQTILNKQRRGLIRKKKLGQHYETSDTDNDDLSFESTRPPLPKSPPPLLTASSHSTLPFPHDCKSLSLPFTEKEKSEANKHITSGYGKPSAYDNILNVWGGDVSKYFAKEDNSQTPKQITEHPNSFHSAKLTLRRTHSFSNSAVNSQCEIKNLNSQNKSEEVEEDFSRVSDEMQRERPATIAVYDDPISEKLSESNPYNDDKKISPEISSDKQSHFSFDNLMGIHPEHKIYAKANVNKSSLRKVINKLTGPKVVHKAVSEPSNSLSNIYANSEFESVHRKSGLVSCMARQCSRTLKERIKQIRTEEWDNTSKVPGSNDSLLGPSVYKQGGPSIGARLASANEQSDYAVPVLLHPPQDKISIKSDLRPDSVLSSSSSNSSGRESETRVLPEINDTSGDSFYEKSFEAIENFLDDEMFRDSAIYSDQEDCQDIQSAKYGTLSPKHSFSYKYRSSFRGDSRNHTALSSFQVKSQSCLEEHNLVSDNKNTSNTETPNNHILENSVYTPNAKKVPPPVPAKPDSAVVQKFRSRGALIQQKLNTFEEKLKSPQEICEEKKLILNPEQNIIFSEKAQNGLSKGWVKQVVGKLQQ
ncbi:UNVERIFIED_CONTAM: hypothetical protein RMT77_001625 [Armadillidium vulgare]